MRLREATQYKEDQHPRDNKGEFIDKAKLDEASSDGNKLKQILSTVTNPTERKKLLASTGWKLSSKGVLSKNLSKGTNLTTENLKGSTSVAEDKLKAISEAARKTAYDTAPVAFHGMTDAKPMKAITVNGLSMYIEKSIFDKADSTGPVGKTIAVLNTDIEGNITDKEFPKALTKTTKKIVLTKQKNKNDDFWEQKYGMSNFKSAATGGDGTIVVYNMDHDSFVSASIFAHEAGHNLAQDVWGQQEPKEDSEYAVAAKEEPPVSEYGRVSPAEDFAEAVMMYVRQTDILKKNWPKKYAAIDNIMKSYEDK